MRAANPRVLREAMPLLKRADTVAVLSFEPDDGAGSVANGHPHAQALLKLLKSHGIEGVSSGFDNLDVSASEAIIGQAAEMNADLIVMGVYGHARLRGIILGGVTRDLLKRAPACLLLAH